MEKLIKGFLSFWEKHICMDYNKTNLPDECFICNLLTCKGCSLEGKLKS